MHDVSDADAERARRGARARAIRGIVRRGHPDQAAVRAIGLVVAIERRPEWQEGVEERLAAVRLLEVREESERAAAIDRAVLEFQVVADLAVAGGERGGQAFVVEGLVGAV